MFKTERKDVLIIDSGRNNMLEMTRRLPLLNSHLEGMESYKNSTIGLPTNRSKDSDKHLSLSDLKASNIIGKESTSRLIAEKF